MQIIQKRIRNYTPGRNGFRPEAIVIHIAEGFLAGAQSWFDNPQSRASAHFMIGKSGAIWQFVDTDDTAWHAGGVANPSWNLLKPGTNPNLYTIGIEHEGFTGEAWSNQMYPASGELIRELCKKYNIPLDREHVIGHYQINSVSRDRCPGSGVDFAKLLSIASTTYEDPAVIAELQQKIKQLEAATADILRRNTQLESENAGLKTRIVELENLVANTRDPTQLLEQLQQLTKEVYNLRQARNELSRRLTQAESELSKGNRRLEDYSISELLAAAARRGFRRN